jgi:hypothetical protein
LKSFKVHQIKFDKKKTLVNSDLKYIFVKNIFLQEKKILLEGFLCKIVKTKNFKEFEILNERWIVSLENVQFYCFFVQREKRNFILDEKDIKINS